MGKLPTKELAERYDVPKDSMEAIAKILGAELEKQILGRLKAGRIPLSPIPAADARKVNTFSPKELEAMDRNLQEALGTEQSVERCIAVAEWWSRNLEISLFGSMAQDICKIKIDVALKTAHVLLKQRGLDIKQQEADSRRMIAEAKQTESEVSKGFLKLKQEHSSLLKKLEELERRVRESRSQK